MSSHKVYFVFGISEKHQQIYERDLPGEILLDALWEVALQKTLIWHSLGALCSSWSQGQQREPGCSQWLSGSFGMTPGRAIPEQQWDSKMEFVVQRTCSSYWEPVKLCLANCMHWDFWVVSLLFVKSLRTGSDFPKMYFLNQNAGVEFLICLWANHLRDLSHTFVWLMLK